MTDDEEPTPGERFRDAIQAVIDQFEDEWIVTGWVLARASVRAEDAHKGFAAFSYHLPPNQGIHISRGLVEMARTYFDQGCRTSGSDDDD